MGHEPVRQQRKQDVRAFVRVPQRHLHFARLGAGRLQAAVHQLQAQVHAHRPPVFRHQFHGDRLWRLEIQKLHGDDQRRAVRILQQPIAVVVAQAEFPEQRLRALGVVFDVGVGEALLVEDAGGVDGHLARHAASEVDDVVHFVAVDGVGKGNSEALIPHQIAQPLVRVVVVRLNGHVADVQARPDVHLGGAVALAELQDRDVLGAQAERGEVELAGGGFGGHQFRVVQNDLGIDGIDIRQLAAFGIHLEVVRIALQPHHVEGALLDAIGAQRGHLLGAFVLPTAQRGHQRHPADEAFILNIVFQRLAVAERGMVLLQKVLGAHEVAAVLGVEVDETGVRLLENVLEGVVVDLHEGAAEHHPRSYRRELGIHPDVVEVEGEIVGGEGVSVGPSQARTKIDGGNATVFADGPAFGQVRQQRAHVCRERDGRFPIEELPGVIEGDAGLAAVLAVLPQGADHHRIVRQALFHRRQTAIVQERALRKRRQADFAGGFGAVEPLLGERFAVRGQCQQCSQ